MSFTLSGGSPTVEVSASARISSQTDTTATITVQSNSWMIYSGSWVQSSGVVANVYVGSSAWLGAKTIFGNGTKTSGTSVHSVTHSYTVNKSTSSQSVYWESRFYSYVDGTNLGHKATKSGYITVGAKTSYTVSYNANGGTNAPASQTKWHGETLTLDQSRPTRTGYTFQGWATSATGSVSAYAGGSYTTNASVTFYAVWKANTYTVSYNANGGSGAPSSQTKTYGVDLTLSSTKPTRTNYNFLGWSTSSTGVTAEYTAGATFTTNAATTLYAVWELAYIPPAIVGLAAHRCASGGASDDYGTYALVTFDWETCQLIGANEVASITIEIDGATAATLTPGGTSGSVSQVVGGTLSIESQYTITVRVADSKNGSTPRDVVLQKASFPMDLKAGGTGVNFGGPAEEDGFHSAWDATFDKSLVVGDGATVTGGLTVDGYETILKQTLNGYPGMIAAHDDGTTFLRTPIQGLIPYRSGGSGSLGTSAWPFTKVCANKIFAGGRQLAVNKVLWSGVYYMHASQTATLSEAVSAQPNGIVLVWSAYCDGSAENHSFSYFFVPKSHVANFNGRGMYLGVLTSLNAYHMSKYVYVYDTKIVGHSDNDTDAIYTGGMTRRNSYYVLRQVIGV